MQLTSILPPDAVLAQLPARDKKQALKLMAAKGAALTGLSEKDIFVTLLEREHLGCTGMGNGVCIPHGRFNNLQKLQAVFAQLPDPIEFGAADGKPVDLIFLLLTPAQANTEHLKALGVISKLLRDKQLCENLRSAGNASVMHSLLLVAAESDG